MAFIREATREGKRFKDGRAAYGAFVLAEHQAAKGKRKKEESVYVLDLRGGKRG
jgi:hypothetical protein